MQASGLLMLLVLFCSGQAVAASGNAEVSTELALALAKQNNCLTCHAIDRKIAGPAWRDVANKYRNDPGAQARLVNKIAKGGSGVWGNMVMPGHPYITEAHRVILVKFVLNLH
jgi:cytochrome c